MTFEQRLARRISETGSGLCVGIDPREELIEGDLEDFLKRFIEETEPHAAAFKPNMAYFEVLGSRGIAILERLLAELAGRVPVILDCKRSDIGETQARYARAYFEHWGVDAVTLNPFLGFDSIECFLEYEGKGVYLLGVTSNPGSVDFQMQKTADGRYVFELVGDLIERGAQLPGTAGLVVGLTNASADVLERITDVPLLLPGLGAQGGDLAALSEQGRRAPLLVNVSRGLMFGQGEESFSARAKQYADRIAKFI
ncbi:MAG: orotidine-5'-phosphate decarboxylase [Verrucomicrobiales bacterium]